MRILIKETEQKRKGKDILLVVLSSLLHGHTVEPQMFVLLKFMIRVYIIYTRYRTTTRIVKINSNLLILNIIFLFFYLYPIYEELKNQTDYQTTFNLRMMFYNESLLFLWIYLSHTRKNYVFNEQFTFRYYAMLTIIKQKWQRVWKKCKGFA